MYMFTTSSAIAMSSPPKYDVFLSFRGEDTRDNFISHLSAELRRKNIETFMDYRLGRGEEISPALYKAIEESSIYVVILSEHYASSTWCLDELTKILECRKKYGREVIPVFYKVDPSNVRHQRRSYAKAFVKHQQRFENKVDSWKVALTQVAGLSGWDSQVTRPEQALVENIMKDILRKLNRCFLRDYDGVVGIDKHIEQIQSLLHFESAAVRIIGIWGMGGIGKTTIASAIYRKIATRFSSSCIILNVQKEIERVGLQRLRNNYITELLGEVSTSSGLSFSYDRRLSTKVLLVLDDVSNSDQFKDLIGRHRRLGQGSRIIVTSRDMQVLKNADVDYIYEVNEMNFEDSLRLFSLNAFKQNYPAEAYVDLSEKVLNYAKGVPLALKVLGLLLCGRTREAWESELEKVERLPDNEIFKVLKLSYDGLDDEQKDIFLDIACFYRGHLENAIAQTLESCGFHARIGMEVLKDRSFISISEGRIVMHDLIQEMGLEIVRQQCVNDPGKRSRLWKHDEIYQVLKRNKGTDAIQCVFLNMSKIEKIQLDAEAFKKMHNLRMIQFYHSFGSFLQSSNLLLPTFLESLPDHLKFLRWNGFPQRSMPPYFCPENLVKLEMPHSHLEQLWEGDQVLSNLKRLDLCCSWNLIQIPDLAQCPNVEEVILSHCTKLVQVYSSSYLSKLKCLWLNDCVELRSLNIPSNILSRSSGLIVLHKCCNLEMFSFSKTNMGVQLYSLPMKGRKISVSPSLYQLEKSQSLPDKRKRPWCPSMDCAELDAFAFQFCADLYKEPKDNIELLRSKVFRDRTPPSLFPSLNELCWLDLSQCESLSSLPIGLFRLKFLTRLYLCGCSNLEEFPEIPETMENLKVLILDGTAIRELPSSLHHLVELVELSLHNCQNLEIIPSSIGCLTKLCKLGLTCCKSLETFPSSIFELKLTNLNFCGCSMLKTFPEILEPSETLAHIILTGTAIKELPSSLEYLVGLQTLSLNSCIDLVSLPNSIVNLNRLSMLDCSGCLRLTEIPNNIGRLSLLTESLRGNRIYGISSD